MRETESAQIFSASPNPSLATPVSKTPPEAQTTSDSVHPSTSTPEPKRKSGEISWHLDTVTPAPKKKLDELLGRALIVTSVSFNAMAHESWLNFFSEIRPAYLVPTPYFLFGPLLDNEYSDVMRSVKIKLDNADSVTIMADGWTNVRGEGLMNFIVATPEPIFLKSVEPKENQETGEYIAKEFEIVIEDVGSHKVY